MSEPLKDFRGKVTPETDAVLEALNRVTGRDKSEIARDVLHKWALEQIEAANLITRFTACEGATGSGEGRRGKNGDQPR